MNLSLLFLTVLGIHPKNSIQLLRQYQPIPPDQTLSNPIGLTFDHSGSVYVMDQDTSKIFVWNPDGSFKTSIVFVSTISGNNISKGMSFGTADYLICDYKTGVIEGKGHYQLEEGSVVMYQRERIFAILPDAEGDFQVWDVELDGLPPLPVGP